MRANVVDVRGKKLANTQLNVDVNAENFKLQHAVAADAEGWLQWHVPSHLESVDVTISTGPSVVHLIHIPLEFSTVELGVVVLGELAPNTPVPGLPRTGYAVTDVKIINSQNIPVEGAILHVTDASEPFGSPTRSVERVSLADGTIPPFTVHGSPRHWKLKIEKYAYLPFELEGSIPSNHILRLTPSRLLRITPPAGQQIRSVRYIVQTQSSNGWKQQLGERSPRPTPAAGESAIIQIPDGDFVRAQVHFESGSFATIQDIPLKRNSAQISLREQLSPVEAVAVEEADGTTTEQVVDTASRPVGNLKVKILRHCSVRGVGASEKEVITDTAGRFVVPSKPGESVAIIANDPNWVLEDTAARLMNPEALPTSRPVMESPRFLAFRSGRIDGRLTFGGRPPEEPVPIALYRIDRAGVSSRALPVIMTICNEAGYYQCSSLRPGRYAIVPKRKCLSGYVTNRFVRNEWPDFKNLSWEFGVELDRESAVGHVDLALPAEAVRTVSGTVYKNGVPRAGAIVTLESRSAEPRAIATKTNPSGEYVISTFDKGAHRLIVTDSEFCEVRHISIEEDQSRRIHFDVSPCAIRGTVSDANGEPAGVFIVLQIHRDPAREFLWQPALVETFTSADGSFHLTAPRPGTYRLLLFDPRHHLASIATDPFTTDGKTDYKIPPILLPRAAPVRIRAGLLDGSPGSGRVSIEAADPATPIAHLAQFWLFPSVEGIVVHGLPPQKLRFQCLPFEDQIVTLPSDGSMTSIIFDKSIVNDTRAGAYETLQWSFGGETPYLYTQENWSDLQSGR